MRLEVEDAQTRYATDALGAYVPLVPTTSTDRCSARKLEARYNRELHLHNSTFLPALKLGKVT